MLAIVLSGQGVGGPLATSAQHQESLAAGTTDLQSCFTPGLEKHGADRHGNWGLRLQPGRSSSYADPGIQQTQVLSPPTIGANVNRVQRVHFTPGVHLLLSHNFVMSSKLPLQKTVKDQQLRRHSL